MSITRILVPVDFSSGTARQVEMAYELAERYGAVIVVLHVVETPVYAPPEGTITLSGGTGRSLQEFARQEAERDMNTLLEAWAGRKAQVTPRIEPGMPNAAMTILDVAKQGQFDLIIMSTHGRHGLEHLLIGSVTDKIVRKAGCAVLVTR